MDESTSATGAGMSFTVGIMNLFMEERNMGEQKCQWSNYDKRTKQLDRCKPSRTTWSPIRERYKPSYLE